MTMSRCAGEWQVWLAGALMRAGGRRAAACCPDVKDETAGWSAEQSVQARRTRRCMDGQLYAGDQAVRDARSALSVRPLRAAGHPRGRVRQLAPERAGGGDRGVRPLHPHVSEPSQRRLRVLPEGPRLFPRGPGTLRLRLRARSLRARSEGRCASRSRRSRSWSHEVPGQPICRGCADRGCATSTNALGDVRSARRALLLQPRRLRRGGQSRAGRRS